MVKEKKDKKEKVLIYLMQDSKKKDTKSKHKFKKEVKDKKEKHQEKRTDD